jgi:hypothetical protein
MRHKRLLVLSVLALTAAAVLAAVALGSRSTTPSAEVDRALREAVVRYRTALHPVRPPQLYGKALTGRRCVAVLRAYERGVEAVATGAAAEHADSYRALQLLIQDEARVAHYRGPDALPVAWQGEVVYWQVLDGAGDRFTVRAAVSETRVSARWDAVAEKLTDVREREYTRAPIYDYALVRSGRIWKVLDHEPWRVREGTVSMYFIDGAIVEVGPA